MAVQLDRDPPATARTPLPLDSRARLTARTVLALVLFALAVWVAWDFLAALAWAGVIAITVWPAYSRFCALFSRGRSRVLIPLLFTLFTGIVLFVPIFLALREIGQQSENVGQWITQLRESGIAVPAWVAQIPVAGEYVSEWWHTNLSNPHAAGALLGGLDAQTVAAWTRALGGELLHRLFLFFITLLGLFFMLRDGAWIADRVLQTADRLLGDPGERMASKMADAVRGTVNGTVVVAVAEGLLIGVGYWVAGVPDPLLFTVLTIAFAMLPFGAWAAFTAAALMLLLQGGSFLAAAGVFGFGAAVMMLGDNFLWPTLIGGSARLPFLLALIGIFGGLEAFGLIGLFLGPVIMAALLTVWREWIVAAELPDPPEGSGRKPHLTGGSVDKAT